MKSFRLIFIRMGLSGEISSYKEHSNNVETLLLKEVDRFNRYHDAQAKKLPTYEAAEYLQYISDRYWELADTHPTIQRKSELISVYTVLENGLANICSYFEKTLKNPVKLSDLSASGNIDKAKKYLEKVVGVDFPHSSAEWEEIKKYNGLEIV